MNLVDQIAEVLERSGQLTAWHRDHLAAEIAEVVHPRIETVEELDALPPETIVKTEGGTVACRHYDRSYGVVFGDERPFSWPQDLATELPAIVLWHPGDTE